MFCGNLTILKHSYPTLLFFSNTPASLILQYINNSTWTSTLYYFIKILRMNRLRSFIPIAKKTLPTVGKLTALTFAFFALQNKQLLAFLPFNRPNTQCFHISFIPSNSIGEVLSRVIRVELNGEFVGYAYCFTEKILVSASLGILDSKKHSEGYEFFIGDKKINAEFKTIGTFENLIFIEASQDILPVLPAHLSAPIITPVHIVQKRTYLSIKNGYYVTDDAGYGIIDGKGEVNSLVIDEKGVIGVVTQVGRDSDRGFLRMIRWKDIYNVAKKLKDNKGAIQQTYLGISVKASEGEDGLYVVRIASDSPLAGKLEMGDRITQVNMNTVRDPEDLMRIISLSKKKVRFEGKNATGQDKKVQIHI